MVTHIAIGEALPLAAAVGAPRFLVFAAALLAHRCWKIPIGDLERLITACLTRSRGRRVR